MLVTLGVVSRALDLKKTLAVVLQDLLGRMEQLETNVSLWRLQATFWVNIGFFPPNKAHKNLQECRCALLERVFKYVRYHLSTNRSKT